MYYTIKKWQFRPAVGCSDTVGDWKKCPDNHIVILTHSFHYGIKIQMGDAKTVLLVCRACKHSARLKYLEL